MSSFIISTLLLIVPWLFLPFTPDFFTPPKQLLLILAVILYLFISASQVILHHKFARLPSRSTLALVFFLSSIILNLIVIEEARMEAIVSRASLFIALSALTYFISAHRTNLKDLRLFLYLSLMSSTLLALFTLIHLLLLSRLSIVPAMIQNLSFTPTGSPLTTLTLLGVGALLSLLLLTNTEPSKTKKALLTTSLALQFIASIALASLMLPGSRLSPSLLPLTASWSIALDALKTPKGIFFGVGMANFSTLYTSFKPLFLNQTTLWNVLFQTSSSEILHLLSTTGFVGLLGFLSLPFAILSLPHQTPETNILKIIIFALLALLLITPGSIVIFALLFIFLGLYLSPHVESRSLSPRTSLFIALALLGLGLTLAYYSARAYLAEIRLEQANQALARKDGKALYTFINSATSLVPTLTQYHLTASEVNLLLASSLSSQPNLSDQDKSQIAQLVSQAVREAKIATSLHPSAARTWQNLGALYRNLVNVAEGSAQFALSSYTQAIALDPANPALRLELGGLFYQLSQVTSIQEEEQNQYLARATQEFQTAIQLKNDYANAYYNLAKALELSGNFARAKAAMQQALAYSDPLSPDYQKASEELDAIKAKLPRSEAKIPSEDEAVVGQTSLNEPSPLPSPLPGGPIDLP